MTDNELIEKIRNLTEAYTIYSDATRMPYVECEPVDYYDLAYIFDNKKEAQDYAAGICKKGNPVRAVELKTVQVKVPAAKENEPDLRLNRNHLREHLTMFPTIGLNAIYYKPVKEEGRVLKLSDVLPANVWEQAEKNVDGLSQVRLTGIYFSQYLHRKDRDINALRDLSEEFYNNLAGVSLFMPIVPDEKQLAAETIDLAKCELPCFNLKNDRNKENAGFLALFTSVDEVGAYLRKNPAKARIARATLQGAYDLINEPMIGCIIDPMSLCIPVRKEDIPRLIEAAENRVLS